MSRDNVERRHTSFYLSVKAAADDDDDEDDDDLADFSSQYVTHHQTINKILTLKSKSCNNPLRVTEQQQHVE